MRILLVDDDEFLMQAIAEQLIQQRYAVDIAIDGKTAQSYLDIFTYDLIVLDLMLPDGNGIDFCRTFRHSGYENPLLILSAHASISEKVQALDAGADDYVIKPFNFDELRARIRALLRREHQALPTILKWGDLSLNPSTCETYYQGNQAHLTPKEFALLELFLRHPNRVYSLNAIIEDLWSFEDPPSEDAVRTHIKGLRQKLKTVGASKDVIKTVYGLGYRLKPEDTATDSKIRSEPDKLNQTPDTKKISGLPLNSSPTQDVTLQAITQAWKQYHSTMQERLDVIETVAVELNNGQINHTLHQRGQINAHKLVGALGSFGFSEGSQMARELEQLLQRSASLDAAETSHFLTLVQRLRNALSQTSPTDANHTATNAVIKGAPLLLILSDQNRFCTDLQAVAQKQNFQTHIKTDLEQVQSVIATIHPQMILIDEALLQGDYTKIQAITQGKEANPMTFLTMKQSPTLESRLEIVQQGITQILIESSPQNLIKLIAQALYSLTAQAKVVLVDDDTQVLEILKTSLEPWGFHLLALDGASKLWDVLKTQSLDVLILDIDMPDINGLELCQVLRADPRWQQLPILFLTVHQDSNIRTQAFEAGADDFINKSVAIKELAVRILNRLKHQPAQIMALDQQTYRTS